MVVLSKDEELRVLKDLLSKGFTEIEISNIPLIVMTKPFMEETFEDFDLN